MMQPVMLDIARATQMGIDLSRLSEDEDRVPADRRPLTLRCPTCDDGILTITHPRRCRECVVEGL